MLKELISDLIVGSTENGIFNPYTITYVFDVLKDSKKKNENQIMIIDEEDVPYEFWSFEKGKNGERIRNKHNSFKIRIAINN